MEARHVGFGLVGRSGSSGSSERSRRNRPAVAVETLEGRALMTGVVANVTTLPATIQAGPMVAASDNSLWFVENNGSPTTSIARIDSFGAKTEVSLPASMLPGTVAGIAADKTGDVWFSVQTPNQSPGYNYRGAVGEITPDGKVHTFQFPSFDDIPGAAAMGGDGNFYVAFSNVQNGPGVARFLPNGNVTEVMVKGATSVTSPTAGPDGNIWFVDGNKIGKVSTLGNVTIYDIPVSQGASSVDLSKAQLTAGGDGNLWFINSGALNQITPSGDVRSVTTPAGQLTSLGESSDGNLWYALQPAAGGPLSNLPGPVVARLSVTGVTTILPDRAGTSSTPVNDIATAPDGSIWFNVGNQSFDRISPSVTLPILTQKPLPLIVMNTNSQFTGAITTFTSNVLGTTAASFTASINWGDGHVSAGSVVANSSGGFDVLGSNYFTGAGGAIETASITVTGPNNAQTVMKNSVFLTTTTNVGPWTPFPGGTTTPTTPITTPPVTTTPVVTTPVVTTPVVTTPVVSTPVVTTPVVTPPTTPVVTTPVVTTPVVAPPVASTPVVTTPVVIAPTTPSSPTPASSSTTPVTTTTPTTTTTTPVVVTSPSGNTTTTVGSTSPGVTVNVNVTPTVNTGTTTTTTTTGPHWVRGPRGKWVLVHGGATVRNVGAAHPKAPHYKAPRHHR